MSVLKDGYYCGSFCMECKKKVKGFVFHEDRFNMYDFERKTLVAVAVIENGKPGWVCNQPLCTQTVSEHGKRRFHQEGVVKA